MNHVCSDLGEHQEPPVGGRHSQVKDAFSSRLDLVVIKQR